MSYATDTIPAALHGADALSPRRSARCCSPAPRPAWPAPGSRRRSTIRRRSPRRSRDDDPLLRRRRRASSRAYFAGDARRLRHAARPASARPFQRRRLAASCWRSSPGRTLQLRRHRAASSACRRAGRAVGAAVGRNPVSVIVPCHRVARQRRRAHRLCRRPRPQDRAAALEAAHRPTARARRRRWSCIEAARRRRAARPRRPLGRRRSSSCASPCRRSARSRSPSSARRRRASLLLVAAARGARRARACCAGTGGRSRCVGVTNSALPFLGFAYAAISIDTGVLGDLQLGVAAVRRGRRLALARRPDDAGTRRRLWRSASPASLWHRLGTRPACTAGGTALAIPRLPRARRCLLRRLAEPDQALPERACRRSPSPPAASSRRRVLLAVPAVARRGRPQCRRCTAWRSSPALRVRSAPASPTSCTSA